MLYLGDYFSGCSVYGAFTTVNSSGVPTSLTGNPPPRLIAYIDAVGGSCTTAGLTLALDCNGRTGLVGFSVNTNLAAYGCGHDVAIVLDGGTVGGSCVSGYTVALFSLDNRSGLRPTIHGRTIALAAGGTATADPCSTMFSVVKVLDQVNTSPCSTMFSVVKVLDRPIVDATSVVASVSGAVGSVTGNVGGNVVGSVGSVTTVSDKTGYRLSATGVNDIVDAALTEPAAVFAWGTATIRNVLAWVGALASNRVKSTSAQQGMCTRDNLTVISRADISDDGTTFTGGPWT